MIFIAHTASCILILLLLWGIPVFCLEIFYSNNPPSDVAFIVFFILLLTAHILIVIFYYRKGYSLFALPLSHFLFPFLHFVLMYLVHLLISQFTFNSSEWVLSWTAVAFIYFIPTAFITLIISIIMRVTRGQ